LDARNFKLKVLEVSGAEKVCNQNVVRAKNKEGAAEARKNGAAPFGNGVKPRIRNALVEGWDGERGRLELENCQARAQPQQGTPAHSLDNHIDVHGWMISVFSCFQMEVILGRAMRSEGCKGKTSLPQHAGIAENRVPIFVKGSSANQQRGARAANIF
jgi:hypothetical protein